MDNFINMDKSQYFGILKQLHDVCRNNPTPKLTAMDAYNEIINFLYLRHLSDNYDKNDTLRKLYEKYCTEECIEEDNHNKDLKKSKSGKITVLNCDKLSDELLPSISNNERNKNIAFVKIMGKYIEDLQVDIGRLTNILHKDEGTSVTDGGGKAQRLICKIYSDGFLPLDKNGKFNINSFPYDALGEGFEQFMRDAGSTGGNWGQYFTNGQVVDYIMEKVNEIKKISKKSKISDPFSGSGGFILRAKNKFNIDGDNLYAHEYDDKIFKFLKFNSNVAGINKDNIIKGDSYDYHDYISHYQEYFDYILTNPPYGESIDISLTGDKRKAEFWKLMKTGKSTIKDSMGLAVYAIISMLKKDGVTGFVTERGIMNNGLEGQSWQKNLRKYMVETCDITDILLLPKGIFAHTKFDTAVIIMQKGRRTKEIKYHEGNFDDKDKGKKGNKKMHIKENVKTVTFEMIVNKDWSLKLDDYIEKKDTGINGILYKPLGEVCEFKRGKVLPLAKCNKSGPYPVIGGGIKPFANHDEFNMLENSILVSQSGANAGYISRYDTKVWASDCFSISYDNNNFLFYFLKLYQTYFTKREQDGGIQTGNAQPHVSIKILSPIKIPILAPDHQQRIVDFMDKFIGDDYKKLDNVISKFSQYNLFNLLIAEDYDGFEKVFKYYDDIITMERIYKEMGEEHKKNIIKACFRSVPYVMKSLGDVCEFNKHKITDNYDKIEYVDIGSVKHNAINCTKEFDFNKRPSRAQRIAKQGDIIYSTVRPYLNNHCIISEDSYKNNLIVSTGFSVITPLKINCVYLYNYLISDTFNNYIKKFYTGQAYPAINQSSLNKVQIPVPSLEDQQKVVSMIETIDSSDSEFNKMMDGFKKTIEMMYNSITSITMTNDETITNNDEEPPEEPTEESEDEEESEAMIVEHKSKNYIVKDNIMYSINKNGSKNKPVGTWNDGKVKKLPKNEAIDV